MCALCIQTTPVDHLLIGWRQFWHPVKWLRSVVARGSDIHDAGTKVLCNAFCVVRGLGSLWKSQAINSTMALYSQAMIGVMGSKQLGFSDYDLTTAKKQTKRGKFFSEMEVVVFPRETPDILRNEGVPRPRKHPPGREPPQSSAYPPTPEFF